ncbi:MAG: hypothetical protein FWD61_15830, partial [Phycisphaerales bacterium]|nr:hypothetical protein [Phycisphaerales bacterium]
GDFFPPPPPPPPHLPVNSVLQGPLHVGHYERRRDLRDDCIARSPQQAHAAGKPMSQREKRGLKGLFRKTPMSTRSPLAASAQAEWFGGEQLDVRNLTAA